MLWCPLTGWGVGCRVKPMATILIADDEEIIRDSLGAILTGAGHTVVAAKDGEHAIKRLAERRFDTVITDLKMPRADGMAVLQAVLRDHPGTPVIVATAHGTIDIAVEAMREGAFDFLTKPFSADEIEARVNRALQHRKLTREADNLRELARGAERPMIGGNAPAMAAVTGQLERMAASDATVLIMGENGTGKEVIARRIHALSPRAGRPFVAVNCAALSAGLLESELFGHVKGAFTGAERDRKGRFELADGGTLLLDEVSEIDPPLQAKLLRVLQERVFEPVGSSESRTADVRVLATTNRDLEESIREGNFRQDLYFRLNVLSVQLPALRDRPQDIEELAEHFLNRHAAALGRGVPRLTPDGVKALKAYRWPGNVRELENVLQRVCILEAVEEYDAALLSGYLGGGVPAGKGTGFAGWPEGVVPSIEEVERKLIEYALKTLEGEKQTVADALGITTKTLRAKIQKWGL
jgi:two-component system, NtrC family, response regulator HydG